jgi:hypothetical protein
MGSQVISLTCTTCVGTCHCAIRRPTSETTRCSQNTAACLCMIRILAPNATFHIKRHLSNDVVRHQLLSKVLAVPTSASSSGNVPHTALLRAIAMLISTWIIYQRKGFAALLQVATATHVTKQVMHSTYCIASDASINVNKAYCQWCVADQAGSDAVRLVSACYGCI